MINPLSQDLPDLPDMALSCDGILHRAYYLYQPKQGYRFGTDAILLAASLSADFSGRVAELGAGVGAVTVGIAHYVAGAHVTAIEKEPDVAACLRYNIALNQLAKRAEAKQGDISDLPSEMAGQFDHVVANPPFHDANGTRSRNQRRALAHQGDGLSLGRWVEAAAGLLQSKGRLSVILRADRADEVLFALRDHGFGQISLQPIWPYKSSPAIRVILSAQKDVTGPFSVLEGLVLHHPDGALTARANAILSGNGAGFLAPPQTGV